jgi:competence protein ComEC
MSSAALISAAIVSCSLALVVIVRARNSGLRILLTSGALAFSLLWGSGFTDAQLRHRLPDVLYGQDVSVTGCVVGDVDRQNLSTSRSRARFLLELHTNSLSINGLRSVRVSWFDAPDWLMTGACLKGTARLKPPRSYANGLSYDYVASMMFQKIDATGYLTRGEQVQGAAPVVLHGSDLANKVKQAALAGLTPESSVWVKGLVFGDKAAFSGEQWRVVRDSGTLHLLVVSGLHVSMIGAMALFLGALIARLLILFSELFLVKRSVAGLRALPVVCALTVTAVYVLLAGSGISLIRAWFMFAVALAIWKLPKRVRRAPLLLMAALVIMTINPLSWTQAGFWYSFCAVAALVFFFEGRRSTRVSALLTPQLLIVFAMLPVMLYFGQEVTPGHLIANFFAIPLVTLIILPLSLLSASQLMSWADPALSFSVSLFWGLLDGLPELPSVNLHGSSTLGVLAVAVLTWIWAGRSWALPACVSAIYGLMLFTSGGIGSQASGVWVVDSGQGQAILASDGKTSVLIDTGPAYYDSFSVASAAVLPLMRQKGIDHLDVLIVSHSDNDHSGGTRDILEAVSVGRFYVGQQLQGLKQQINCHSLSSIDNQAHVAPGANLRIEFVPVPEGVRDGDNNQSCVVRLHWSGYRILIPGDADLKVERALIVGDAERLKSDILIAGHHGSNSSTSSMWLKAVAPQGVLFSAGYRNRFNHPHPDVIGRIVREGLPYVNTATSGLIEITPEGQIKLMRAQWMPRWHAPPDAERDFSLHGHVLE